MEYLENSLLNNSSLPQSIKSILNNPKFNGVHNVISSLIDTDSKYTVAISTALGGSASYLVVDTPNIAKELIYYLKNNNLGRATFMPLSVIKPRGIDYETMDLLEREIDYLGTMAEFVRYDEKFRPVVLNQLGNVVLVSDLDSTFETIGYISLSITEVIFILLLPLAILSSPLIILKFKL